MLSAAVFALALAFAPDPMNEAPIVPGAIALPDPGRYRSARSFDETLDFYQRLFNQAGGVRWRNVVNLPGIKAKHIENLRKKTRWDGINIYEYKGEVRIFVVPAKPQQKATQKTKGAK